MSCGPENPTFRLLDAYVGWEEDGEDGRRNLIGLSENDPEGLRLALENPDEIDPGELLSYLPPPRLARGCGPCDWYLVTPPPSRLLRLDRCAGRWLPVGCGPCDPGLLRDTVAVAARSRRLAVADRAARTVLIWAGEGERLSGAISREGPGPIAFTPLGELLVIVESSRSILRFGPTGDTRGELRARLPAGSGTVNGLAVGDDCAVWLVTRLSGWGLRLWRAAFDDRAFQTASVRDLARTFPPTGLSAADPVVGFCLKQQGPNGVPVERCFSWYGRPLSAADVPRPVPPKRYKQGQLLTHAIDSSLPRCRWHRMRITAEVPPGTTLAVTVSSSEVAEPPDQGVAELQWTGFPAGKPHPDDWQTAPAGSLDFLVMQPVGRYLFVRMRLTGDGIATPAVRCIRLDFPRSTSLEFLPSVYRENPDAEDFTERFLSLFDAAIADLDRAIERFPALLDPSGVPDETLPWLGAFLDIAFDPRWEPERRRAILRAAPGLYRRRGTAAGLIQAFRLVFDVTPAVQELAPERSWGILRRGARLGEVRLFGRSRARFRLGSSALSRATLKSYGNPDHDPLNGAAYRFRVLVPPSPLQGKDLRERMEQLVASQKPAHTVAMVRFGGNGLVLGVWSAVGVDTVFTPLPAPVLGARGNIRLRRMSTLWPAQGGRKTGLILDQDSRVGIQTVAG